PAAAPRAESAAPAAASAAPTATQPPAATEGPRRVDQVKVAVPAYGTGAGAILTAATRGYLEEEGIAAEVIRAPGGVSTPALVADEVQFNASVTPVDSAIARGAPLKIIDIEQEHPAYSLLAKTEITSPRDLANRVVAIASRGDSGEISVLKYLRHHGVPTDGVAWIAVGAGDGKVAAMQSGGLDASPVTWRDIWALRSAGVLDQLHELVPLYREPYIQMFYNGVATSDKLIQTNPDLVQRFANAIARAHLFILEPRNKPAVLRVLKEWEPGRADDDLSGEYDFVLGNLTKEGVISDEAVRESIRTSAEQVGTTTEFAPADFVDFSFIRRAYERLRQQGWQP
ncbi:MAG TPA: ABC transporter substrate-binding protein, partial [Chloroflexota bacterium]|nr:ABC transporter substrate-binding protein [Chloroflexota bacterium]